VQALPEPYAVVVDAVYRGGRPLEAVAQQLSSNLETVKKRLQRARAQIAECLQRKGMLA
jgi:DNA-directed RNA polymerase specialized sigma24 family protein